MSTNEAPNIAICRLCLAHTATTFPLTESNGDSSMLEALTSLKIEPSDEISTVMCLKCRLNLRLAFSIQQNMLRAQERFKRRELEESIKEEILVLSDTSPEESEVEPTERSDYTATQHNLSRDERFKCRETTEILSESPSQECPKGEPTESLDSIQGNTLEDEEKLKCREVTESINRETVISSESAPTYSSDPASHQCDICNKTFPQKKTLKAHKYNVHVKLKCPECGKEITQANMKRHLIRHTQPNDTMCELCGASMKMQDLRPHMFYRHRDHSYKCNYCDLVFKKKTRRDVHENREHLDNAKFVCDICGKKFYMAKHLTTHNKMTHLKLRPHICDFCHVGFSSKLAMRTHRRQHTNETPYKCDVCGEGFKQKVSMKSHMRSKHDIKEELTSECKVCGRKFAGRMALLSHSRIH